MLEKHKLAEQILAVVNDLLRDKGLVHTVKGTAAKRPDAKDDVNWHVAMRPGKRRALDKTKTIDNLIELSTLFALSKLWMARAKLLVLDVRCSDCP